MKISQPAFPTWIETDNMAHGMMLRDYFAAAALPAIIKDWYDDGFMVGDGSTADTISIIAYKIADAMMKAREE